MNVQPHSSCSCPRCSSLSLAGRIQIIRDFESHRSKKPSIKSLAAKFDVCYTEIKHILLNRENILFSYQNARKQKGKEPLPADERQKNLGFLGKVMYEYLQRVLYSKYAIDEEKVLQKAQEFKSYIGVQYFEPNKAWLHEFKSTYNIYGFDLMSLRRTIKLKESKRPHLSAMDVVEYVRRQEREAKQNHASSANSHYIENEKRRNRTREYEETTNGTARSQRRVEVPNTYCHNEDGLLLEPMMSNENISNGISLNERQIQQNENYYLEPTVVYESIDDADAVADYGDVRNNSAANHLNNSHSPQHKANHSTVSSNKRGHSTPMPSIESVEEALEHLKILEEYAMLQDNFRAIGLLTQLEQVFKKQTK